jgi:hypothetical protein
VAQTAVERGSTASRRRGDEMEPSLHAPKTRKRTRGAPQSQTHAMHDAPVITHQAGDVPGIDPLRTRFIAEVHARAESNVNFIAVGQAQRTQGEIQAQQAATSRTRPNTNDAGMGRGEDTFNVVSRVYHRSHAGNEGQSEDVVMTGADVTGEGVDESVVVKVESPAEARAGKSKISLGEGGSARVGLSNLQRLQEKQVNQEAILNWDDASDDFADETDRIVLGCALQDLRWREVFSTVNDGMGTEEALE